MSTPSLFFNDLLDTLAGQLFGGSPEYAQCGGRDFGSRISDEAKKFFSVCVVEVDMQDDDLATVGVLVDNSTKVFRDTRYTFFVFVDASKGYQGITDDLKAIFKKSVLVHETCHFVFYHELFVHLGGNSTSTVYTEFQSRVSGKLKGAIVNDPESTGQTVMDEHRYADFLRDFWQYDNRHWDKDNRTSHDFKKSNRDFFTHLTKRR